MGTVFSFFATVSALSVVMGALYFLTPEGVGGRFFKYSMGIFLICVILSTFDSSFEPPFDGKREDSVDLTSENARSLSEETAVYVLEELLSKCNIKFEKIDIITDNSDSSDINITKARIDFVNEEDFDVAEEIIKNQTGIYLVR